MSKIIRYIHFLIAALLLCGTFVDARGRESLKRDFKRGGKPTVKTVKKRPAVRLPQQRPNQGRKEIIVKFKCEGPHAFEQIVYNGAGRVRSFQMVNSADSESLAAILSDAGHMKSRHLFVRSRANSLTASQARRLMKARLSRGKQLQGQLPRGMENTFVLRISGDVDAICERLRNHPSVVYATSNSALGITPSFANEPNDPQFYDFDGEQWGIIQTETNKAWSHTKGDGVTVAVVDFGIWQNHPDIKDNLWVNPGEVANNGVDDDGNGYIDDVHGIGHNGTKYTKDISSNMFVTELNRNHGGAVSGVIGAVTNNNVGIAGMAPNCRIMTIRPMFRNASGVLYFSDALAEAIDYAVENGAKVICNSYRVNGTEDTLRPVMDAIRAANAAGVFVVFAAGNENLNVPYILQNMPETFSVAAVGSDGIRKATSNWGPKVDLAAPGRFIRVHWGPNGYDESGGTSIAAPHVAATAALAFSLDPSLTSTAIKGRLKLHKDNFPVTPDRAIGAGILNTKKVIASLLNPVTLTSPVAGSTLSSSATFNFSREAVVVRLKVGTRINGTEIFDSGELNNKSSITVNNIPQDGSNVYVRFEYSHFEGDDLTGTNHAYVTDIAPPSITSPSTDTDLLASATFTIGSADNYQLQLTISDEPGGSAHFDSGVVETTEIRASGIPQDGRDVNVRLSFRASATAAWNHIDSTYGTVLKVPEIYGPRPGDYLTDLTPLIKWRTKGIRRFILKIGNTPGADDIYRSEELVNANRHQCPKLNPTGDAWYVTLSYLQSGVWKDVDVTYPIPTADITGPNIAHAITTGQPTFNIARQSNKIRYYRIKIGRAPGKTQYYDTRSFRQTGTELSFNHRMTTPLDLTVGKVHVRLNYKIGGQWRKKDYVYNVSGDAHLYKPADGSDLLSTSGTQFKWQLVGSTQFRIWVGHKRGFKRYYESDVLTGNTHDAVFTTPLPADGSRVFVRFFYDTVDGEKFKDYIYYSR